MKKQTLEEAANKANGYNVYAKETKAPIFNEGFIAGAKWQQEQAKEMEKEQIENAFENGMNAVNIHNLEQYYNETFKQQEQ